MWVLPAQARQQSCGAHGSSRAVATVSEGGREGRNRQCSFGDTHSILNTLHGTLHEGMFARRAKFSHALVWPLELGLRTPTLQGGHLSGPSCTRGGFFDFEVGGHDGAYKGRVHVIVPLGETMGKVFDCQRSYNVLVLRVPGLHTGGSDVWG